MAVLFILEIFLIFLKSAQLVLLNSAPLSLLLDWDHKFEFFRFLLKMKLVIEVAEFIIPLRL